MVAQRYKNNVSRGQKEVLWYFSSIFQCNILAVLFSAVFYRYFGGIFQCLKLPIRYRYLGIWKKNTAYRHRTHFSPTAGHWLKSPLLLSLWNKITCNSLYTTIGCGNLVDDDDDMTGEIDNEVAVNNYFELPTAPPKYEA